MRQIQIGLNEAQDVIGRFEVTPCPARHMRDVPMQLLTAGFVERLVEPELNDE